MLVFNRLGIFWMNHRHRCGPVTRCAAPAVNVAECGRLAAARVDGDFVILHVEVSGREAGKTAAIVDIFRLDSAGKIVEHWDVTQPVPEKTASGNSMF